MNREREKEETGKEEVLERTEELGREVRKMREEKEEEEKIREERRKWEKGENNEIGRTIDRIGKLEKK